MIVTLFRARLKAEVQEEYGRWTVRMGELAQKMRGYVSHKRFVADDGEQVTIVEFESEEAQRAWSLHPEHVEAKKKGRGSFYLEYRAQICTVQRSSVFPKEGQ